MTAIQRTTQFSPCRKYRYTLWRKFGDPEMHFDGCNDGERGVDLEGYLMVIGLNPSTADETKDDPTIRKCIGFAKRWGFGNLCMTNLFAWRDTKPENMKAAAEPIGSENDEWIYLMARDAGMVLCAWGKNGTHLGRSERVVLMLQFHGIDIKCLKLNKDGSPMHPLYVPYEVNPVSFIG